MKKVWRQQANKTTKKKDRIAYKQKDRQKDIKIEQTDRHSDRPIGMQIETFMVT